MPYSTVQTESPAVPDTPGKPSVETDKKKVEKNWFSTGNRMICQKYYRFLIYFRVKRTYYRLEIKMAVGIMKISFKKKKRKPFPQSIKALEGRI